MKLSFIRFIISCLFFLGIIAVGYSQNQNTTTPEILEIPVLRRLSVASNIPNNFLRESVMLRYQNFGASLTASRSFAVEMDGYQFDADLRAYLTPALKIKNETYLYGRGSYTTFNWIQPDIHMDLRNKEYTYASVGIGYRHSFGKRKNLFYELSFGVKVYQAGKVSYDTIRPNGQNPIEARLMFGYQWRNTKTKTKSANAPVLNHKISISNPLGAMAKVRLRYEIMGVKKGLLVAGSVNYFAIDNSLIDSTQQKTKAGWQVYAEGRRYIEPNKGLFLYGKVGKGQSAMYEYNLNYHGYYNYQFFGGGFGVSQNISRRIFYEINLGVKYVYGDNDFKANYQSSASNLIGVMSNFDVNAHIGIYINERKLNTSVEEDEYQTEIRRFRFRNFLRKTGRVLLWLLIW